MSGNTSASGGPLTPISAPPAQDSALDDVLQALVVALTGLPGTMVRPRYQPEPPVSPAWNVNWCAIGITELTSDETPFIKHNSEGDGTDTLMRHEQIDALASFYGTSAFNNATLLRDGLAIPQNSEALLPYGIKVRDAGPLQKAPALVNARWVVRVDVPMSFRRQYARTYNVNNLVAAEGVIVADTGATSIFEVNEP